MDNLPNLACLAGQKCVGNAGRSSRGPRSHSRGRQFLGIFNGGHEKLHFSKELHSLKIFPIQIRDVTEQADHTALSYRLYDTAVSDGRFAVCPVSDTRHLETSGADVSLHSVMPPFFFMYPRPLVLLTSTFGFRVLLIDTPSSFLRITWPHHFNFPF